MQNYAKDKTGFYFESAIDHGKLCGVARGTVDEDHNRGTDFKLNGLPVDFTLHFSGKDHMENLKSPLWLDHSLGVYVEFGIRTGNSHNGFTPFKIPVLVIGLHCPSLEWLDFSSELFIKQFSKIGEYGEDLFWNWMDSHPEYEF